jgi:hypothetical protein
MTRSTCAGCARFLNEVVTLRWEYHAAREVLSSTPLIDPAYRERWTDLARVSELLNDAQRLEHAHNQSHHTDDLFAKRPERRVSPVPDRRLMARGGRRCTDYGWSSPPPVVACAECPTGTAGLLERSTIGTLTVTYQCWECGHRFDRIAES